MTDQILENQRIGLIAQQFLNPPNRLNKIHEADAEIIEMVPGSSHYLAITTDALSEEIASGLYADPFLAGWMLAMANFSDLAAVGAEPLGLLVTITYPEGTDSSYLKALATGISSACQQLNTYVLGGDTNFGERIFLSGCAVGLVPKDSVILRVGSQPGDKLYLSGLAGLGSIFALLRLIEPSLRLPLSFYQPEARIAQGKIIRKYCSGCMDTSDGVFHTLDTLMRLNNCRFVLTPDWSRILHPVVLQVCRERHIPEWLSLASVHGEFELCFTIKPDREKPFLREAAAADWFPIAIGTTTTGKGVGIKSRGDVIDIDTVWIRNIAETAGSDPKKYLAELLQFTGRMGL